MEDAGAHTTLDALLYITKKHFPGTPLWMQLGFAKLHGGEFLTSISEAAEAPVTTNEAAAHRNQEKSGCLLILILAGFVFLSLMVVIF
jgi:hypothetical protein